MSPASGLVAYLRDNQAMEQVDGGLNTKLVSQSA